MKTAFLATLFALCLMTAELPAVDVLVVGSTHFFDGKGNKAYDANEIVRFAKQTLEKDLNIKGNVKFAFEEVYKTRSTKIALGQKGAMHPTTFRCHSLAQWYFWPEGRTERLANLQGEGKTKWDYVVLLGDPYLIAKMPGIYAEGVKLVADTVRKGKAKPVLLVPWINTKSVSLASVAEVVCRVGMGAEIDVVPGNAVRMVGKKCEGVYDVPHPFAMKYVDKRKITYHHTGTSSERGIEGALKGVVKRCGVSARKVKSKEGSEKIDFNYGRANSNFEKNKQYKVDPNQFGRSYGFPMQEQAKSAAETMLYGIDKRRDDGTDLGIAWDMIRQDEVSKDVRCIPIRLMWAKIHEADPGLKPLRDSWHMSRYLDTASATFMYTLLSGRCPMDEKPDKSNEGAWRGWVSQQIGYETAWRMSHLSARVPGFSVKPLDNTTTVSAESTSRLAVKLHYTPKANVTVTISMDKPGAATVEPATLTFTPQNHGTAQNVTITGGDAGKDARFKVKLVTKSEDKVFDQLHDAWSYTAAAK